MNQTKTIIIPVQLAGAAGATSAYAQVDNTVYGPGTQQTFQTLTGNYKVVGMYAPVTNVGIPVEINHIEYSMSMYNPSTMINGTFGNNLVVPGSIIKFDNENNPQYLLAEANVAFLRAASGAFDFTVNCTIVIEKID